MNSYPILTLLTLLVATASSSGISATNMLPRVSVSVDQQRPHGVENAVVWDESTEGHKAEYLFLRQSSRVNDRPSFELRVAQGSYLARKWGSTNVTLEPLEEDRLTRFAAAAFAKRARLSAAEVGHCLISLNARGLGIYQITPSGLDATDLSKSGVQTIRMSGDITKCGTELNSTQSNLMVRVANACFATATQSISSVTELVDTDSFVRLMAFESIAGDKFGYGDTGITGVLGISDKGQLVFLPKIHKDLFTLVHRPVFIEKEGMVARALMTSKEFVRDFADSLRALAGESNEVAVIEAISSREQLLMADVSGPLEAQRLSRSSRLLKQRIVSRFAAVREQLMQVPTNGSVAHAIQLSPKPKQLSSVRSACDYGALFLELYTNRSSANSGVRVRRLNISAPADVLQNLSWRSKEWITANLSIDGVAYPSTALRLKGHATRESFLTKPSFTLKFNLENKEVSLDGMTKVHIHNARFDPSFLNEFIASWLFKRAGVPAPKVEFADVSVNGKDYGLFILSEGITKTFLRRELGSSKGLLWEGELRDLGGELDLDAGKPPMDYGWPKEAVAKAQQIVEGNAPLGTLATHIDLPAFARFAASEIALGHSDGYCLGASNYRIYQPTPSSPLVFIPHGTDALHFDTDIVLPKRGMIARALTSAPDGREMFIAALAEVLTNRAKLDILVNEVADVSHALQPILQRMSPQLASQQLAEATKRVRTLGNRFAYLGAWCQTNQGNAITLANKTGQKAPDNENTPRN